jgi:hypothetical protein
MEPTSATTTGTVAPKRREATLSATTGAKGAANDPALTYQVVEHMIAAAESRTDVKLVELRAHVDTLKVDLTAEVERSASGIQLELAKKPGTGAFIATVLGAMAIVVGVLAFGGDRFDGGVQVTSVSVQQAQEARDLAIENAKQIQALVNLINSREPLPQVEAPSEP